MKRIRVEQPFVLYARCTVKYDGRAKSTLELGNYLIIHKNDGALMIQGGTLCTPRNYQPPKAIMKKVGDKLISTFKGETITINVEKINFYKELKDWSSKKINISKTEAELRDKIYDNIEDYIGITVKEVFKEFRTPVGNVDVLAIDTYNTYHIIEVKRGKASLSACSQLERYCNYFVDIMKNVTGYIASPNISNNALKFTKENHQIYLKVEHSI